MEQHGPIPAPPDFPVVWENPDDERLFWTRDAMHFPNPVNALEDELSVRIAQGNGFAAACEAYDLPIRLRTGAPHQHLPLHGRGADYGAAGRD